MADLNGKAVAAVSVGALLVWSGIKGWSILGTLEDVITGVRPSGSVAYPLTSGESVSGGNIAGGQSNIASIAMQYEGHAYRFGGAPGPNAEGPWDCSSFVNYVVGVKAGLAIPGYGPGKYTGTVHGPASGMWAIWPGLQRISRQDVSAGDILVWGGLPGHIGIALDNNRMISALNPHERTKVTTIAGFRGRGVLLTMGRLR